MYPVISIKFVEGLLIFISCFKLYLRPNYTVSHMYEFKGNAKAVNSNWKEIVYNWKESMYKWCDA